MITTQLLQKDNLPIFLGCKTNAALKKVYGISCFDRINFSLYLFDGHIL